MNQDLSVRPLFNVGIVGLLLVPLLAAMLYIGPSPEKAPLGYGSVIIAFEFVSNKTELSEVLSPLTIAEVDALDVLNYIDFPFMIIYGTFLFLFMTKLSSILSVPFLLKVRWLALIIVFFDVSENIQLYRLTQGFGVENVDLVQVIDLLGVFTWCKWSLLTLTLAIIGRYMFQLKRRWWLSLFFVLPLIFEIWVLYTGLNAVKDLFTTSVFIGFLVILIFSFIHRGEISE